MKIGIVGANSSIAQAIIPRLKEQSEIVLIGRTNADIIMDLNSDIISLPKDIQVIIHTAADFGGTSFKDTCDAINVNILGTLKLFEAAVISGVKQFIYISSIYSHLKSDSYQYSIYSITKRSSEDILKLYAINKGIKLVILRPSQIYGSISNRIHQPFFYTIIDKIQQDEKIVFYGSKDPIRNFIHIEDLSNIIYYSLQNEIEGDYDCAFPENTSFLAIANAAKLAFKSNSEIVFDDKYEDQADINIEFETSLYKNIDYHPKISINRGMRMLAECFNKREINE
ncbi:SDR family oxidoreductase [Ulvibacter sp.]|nr:SDR family oxidoreductase [Ulvibacter sp.]